MIKLTDIFVYPIKSFGGIQVNESLVHKPGLEHDRRWMLVDLDGNFLSQRTHPKMATLAVEWNNGEFHVKDKLNPTDKITLPIIPQSNVTKKVRIWDDHVNATLVDPTLSKWIQQKLKIPCELVHLPESITRPIEEKHAVSDESVSFADSMPYLLISQASLDNLNSRLKKQLRMDRFRPNLVVAGTEPFEEDQWDLIQVGGVRFKIVKPCARCIMTTVDQDTGEIGKEPLSTLSKFRKNGNKIYFGQNMVPVDFGMIRQNEVVKIIRKKN
ncbi:MAG TPA: MOSC N-terminal beta barrel domain-containing protein [Lunatimonas sp.]|nr:MOSC N-terminal beta barrel domain-containing protein [Lunatimonas sp.]